jgi:hypothetical protein
VLLAVVELLVVIKLVLSATVVIVVETAEDINS